LTADASRKLKSGKSMTTSAFGFSLRAASTSRFSTASDLGTTRSASDEAGHAEPAIVREQLSASSHQALSAKAENSGIGLSPPNFNCESAGV
jgi:hypothetical protein